MSFLQVVIVFFYSVFQRRKFLTRLWECSCIHYCAIHHDVSFKPNRENAVAYLPAVQSIAILYKAVERDLYYCVREIAQNISDVPDSIAENVEELFACRAPYNPQMLNSDERLQSFSKNWPVKGHVTPLEMADAGFYYVDDSDRVICFCCG